jgi:hypothetical protein
MDAAGFKPLEQYKSRVNPWKSIHIKCGYEVTPTLANVSKGSGCKFCTDTGIDYSAPGILYLMRHDGFHSIKVGISSTKARKLRIPTHEKYGWKLTRRWDLSSASTALTIETIILSKWRKQLGAPPAVLPSEMPQGGASETGALIHVDIEDTASYIDQLVFELETLHLKSERKDAPST